MRTCDYEPIASWTCRSIPIASGDLVNEELTWGVSGMCKGGGV